MVNIIDWTGLYEDQILNNNTYDENVTDQIDDENHGDHDTYLVVRKTDGQCFRKYPIRVVVGITMTTLEI